MVTAKLQADKIDRMLAQQAVFGELLTPAERQYLMDRSQVRDVQAGEVLCQQLRRENNVYILLLGEVEVTESQAAKPLILAKLQRGEIFGEIAALFHLPRMSTVTASRPSVVLDIPGEIFEDVIQQRSALRDAVWQRYHRRLCMTVLRMVNQFRHLPEVALTDLVEKVSLVSYHADCSVIESGKSGDALFIIISGEATVYQQVDGHSECVAVLKAGDYFGEWSLLTGAPCSATVVSRTPLSLLCIDRQEFFHLIQEYPSARDGIDQVAHNRQSQSISKQHAVHGEVIEAIDKKNLYQHLHKA